MPSYGNNIGVLRGEHKRKASLTHGLGHDYKYIVADHPSS